MGGTRIHRPPDTAAKLALCLPEVIRGPDPGRDKSPVGPKPIPIAGQGHGRGPWTPSFDEVIFPNLMAGSYTFGRTFATGYERVDHKKVDNSRI